MCHSFFSLLEHVLHCMQSVPICAAKETTKETESKSKNFAKIESHIWDNTRARIGDQHCLETKNDKNTMVRTINWVPKQTKQKNKMPQRDDILLWIFPIVWQCVRSKMNEVVQRKADAWCHFSWFTCIQGRFCRYMPCQWHQAYDIRHRHGIEFCTVKLPGTGCIILAPQRPLLDVDRRRNLFGKKMNLFLVYISNK